MRGSYYLRIMCEVLVSNKCYEVNKQKYYGGVDLVKFICSLLVVAIHVPPLSSIDTYADFIVTDFFARIAVPFFFVAAGFFLFVKVDISNIDTKIIRKYLYRVLALYFIWTGIYFIWILDDIFRHVNGPIFGLIVWLRNLLFVGSYVQLWYLNALVVAVACIVYLLRKQIEIWKLITLSCALYCIGLLGTSYFGMIVPLVEDTWVWNILKIVQLAMDTTRNGFFEGIPFMMIGLVIANYDFQLSYCQSIVGFLISMCLLFIEASILHFLDWPRRCDMYLFLIPVSFFLFQVAKNISIKECVAKQLRIMSILIFFIHYWIERLLFRIIIPLAMEKIDGLDISYLKFGLTFVITVCISWIVMKISQTERFKSLRKIF